MDPVIVFRTFNVPEAQVLLSRLQAAGFHPDLKDEYTSLAEGFSAPFGGVKVLVPSSEAEEAKTFLSAE
jgi:hypothetical protein